MEPITFPAVKEREGVQGILRHPATAWIILACSLVLTAMAWAISDNFVTQRARDRFAFQAADIEAAIRRRMLEYEAVLRGGIGLFLASDEVSRQEWHAYVSNLQIDRYFPGIQGVGFSKLIPPADLIGHVAAIRSEGFPDYTVRPPGERDLYTSIIFLEPFAGRNLRAFGYDMYSEAVRREGMERARDTGQAAVSGMVTLVQETDQDVQRGFLMYLPLYAKGASPGTEEQRRASLQGFVYSPFRIKDFLRGILGSGMADVSFEIYDGEKPSRETLLYDDDESFALLGGQDARPEFSAIRIVEMGGHKWTLYLYSRPGYVTAADASQPMVVAVGGVLIDVLLFVIIGSIARQERRAVALANRMTAELREKTAALERSNADLEHFAHVASHDLQEPLRAVSNYLQLLERRYGDRLDEDGREFVGFAVDGAKRMRQLVRDLLEYSRVGSRVGEMRPVDLREVVDAALSDLEIAIRDSEASVTVDPALPVVHGNPGLLTRLFQNLLGNALKYRHPDRPPVVELRAERNGRFWKIAVRDNGLGIEPQYFERIFVIFQRLHTHERYEGTGVGLAVCRRIVERHGGRIWVESSPGNGSSFFFTLAA